MKEFDRLWATTHRDLPFPGAMQDRHGKIHFAVYAPGKDSVHLIGDFNDFDRQADPLEQVSDQGLWTVSKQLPEGDHAYQYVIDGDLVICDPYARRVDHPSDGGVARAIAEVGATPYEWHHDGEDRPGREDLIVYEINLPDFTPGGGFRDAVDKLDYLAELGVNCIELMPVFGVEEHDKWGYTPTLLFAPNQEYGRPEELKWLVDESHRRGISVVLDIVLTHTGREHPFNRMYDYDDSPWYGQGPVQEDNEYGLPQLDYCKPAARCFAGDVIEYWMEEYHVDGFRFDYLKNVGISEDGHGIPTLVEEARRVRANVLLIGEHLPEAPEMMIDTDLDACWHARFSHAMKALLTESEVMGYDWGDFEHCVNVLDAEQEGYGDRPGFMLNYTESHDEQPTVLEATKAGFDEKIARRKSALGATVLLTAVGKPMLHAGQELGDDQAIDMNDTPVPWDRLDRPGGAGLHDHYQRMCRFRHDHPGLQSENLQIDRINADSKTLVYHRWNDDGDEIVVAVNFLGRSQTVQVPFPRDGTWRELFTAQDIEVTDGTAEVEIDHYAARIFTQ
ncbi:MAG: alpha-amylase family glycosyl hydrolase [Phycisphaerae bacterium]